MFNQKISIAVGHSKELKDNELMQLIKNIGFDGVAFSCSGTTEISDLIECANQVGLLVTYLHAPYVMMPEVWSNDEEASLGAAEKIIEVISLAAKYSIPAVVIHAWCGFDYKFDKDNLGFWGLDKIVEAGEKTGVKLAFENTEGLEFLREIMNRYKDREIVGFCWDSGHEACYNFSEDMLSEFGDRLMVTHINDNVGIRSNEGKIFWTDDLHLLPYDGIIDWDEAVIRLKKAKKLEFLNLELSRYTLPDYNFHKPAADMTDFEFYSEGYKRAAKIAFKYSK